MKFTPLPAFRIRTSFTRVVSCPIRKIIREAFQQGDLQRDSIPYWLQIAILKIFYHRHRSQFRGWSNKAHVFLIEGTHAIQWQNLKIYLKPLFDVSLHWIYWLDLEFEIFLTFFHRHFFLQIIILDYKNQTRRIKLMANLYNICLEFGPIDIEYLCLDLIAGGQEYNKQTNK